MNEQINNKIKEIMSSVFNIDINTINDGSSPETIETWDSMQHMNLIVALEEEFGITFTDDQIGEMLDFKSTVDAVLQNKK